jgi:acetylornithine deacetylase/succinyl-diaminopimelate desuccinylase-like protein
VTDPDPTSDRSSDRAFDWARDLLVELIEIPSVSADEQAIAERLEQLAVELGFPVRRQEVPGYGPNLLIGAEDASLMLTAHMDTVPAAWQSDGRAVVEGDIVHGLGAVDDKGSVVACLLALRLIREAGVDLAELPVSVGLTVDEEEDGNGSIALAALAGPRHVIALEGTELEICVAEAGVLQCVIEVPGRSHHGSRPELGDNAVHKAIGLVQELLALPVMNRSHAEPPEMMDNVAFVQEFKGGSDLYVVPDSARLLVVVRLGGVGEAAEAQHELEELCRRWGAAFELIEAVDPVLAPPGAPLVSLLGDAVRRVTGHEPVRAAMPSWTDAHSFAEEGSTAVVFGPGTLRFAHRPDEHIDVREIVTSARILAEVALRSREL